MKKLIMAALAIGSVFTASAQTKTTFGITGGLNFAKLTTSFEGASFSASTGSLTHFSAGIFADAPVGGNFSIQPGLYYTGKGGKSTFEGESSKLKLSYLQLPVNVVYNVPVSAGKFFFGAGPYAAYGLSAKAEDDSGVSEKLKFGNDNGSNIKRTDFGATGLVGFNDSQGVKSKNRVFGVSVGFTF
jgi:hypothetical protein